MNKGDMRIEIKKTFEYQEWLATQTEKSKLQIAKRLSNIQYNDHFGEIKEVGGNVWELKWKNGRRIYYVYIPKSKILLLIGGSKNGQNYDISQAKKILKKYS